MTIEVTASNQYLNIFSKINL